VPRVKCSYTEAATVTTLKNAHASRDVFRDVLLRTPIASEVTNRIALEKSLPLEPGRELSVVFARFPTLAVLPNTLVHLPDGALSSALMPASDLRVYELSVSASATDDDVDVDYGGPATSFELAIHAKLETSDETRTRLPAFAVPQFPGTLEGKIVSEVGTDEELTYRTYPDNSTSVDEYRIKIPLFEDQVVTAPYEPYSGSGAIYVPLYKGERVLVALEFDRVRIRELLDWRGEARVPLASQGQQLFFGKSSKDNTSMLHDYQSQKPVFRILRTNKNDTALFRLEEGKLTLKVEEKTGG
jgi:hypothetical protein